MNRKKMIVIVVSIGLVMFFACSRSKSDATNERRGVEVKEPSEVVVELFNRYKQAEDYTPLYDESVSKLTLQNSLRNLLRCGSYYYITNPGEDSQIEYQRWSKSSDSLPENHFVFLIKMARDANIWSMTNCEAYAVVKYDPKSNTYCIVEFKTKIG